MTEYEDLKKELAKPNEIKINPEYSNLVPPLSVSEYLSLKNSISKTGLRMPIIINSDHVILDGHNRDKICQELGIEARYEVIDFKDKLEEKSFVIETNLERRHLSGFQRIQLSFKLAEIESEKARLRQLSKLKVVKDTLPLAQNYANGYDEEIGKVSKIIAKKTGYSSKTCEMAKKIIQKGSEDQIKRLIEEKTTISKEYKKIQKDIKRRELLQQIINLDSKNNDNDVKDKNCKLMHGDFIEIGKDIPDNSIDLIFTDPPYGKEYLFLYQELARLAVRVLKPGGNIVALFGHIILDEVFKIFHQFSLNNNNSGLKYWWTLAVKHSGHHKKIYQRNVFAEWKPLLWYVKGEKPNNLVISNTLGDFIESIPVPKLLHEWEQSTIEAEHIIKHFTLENQTVLDPMMGTGTTGLPALMQNRKFIGIEKDKHTFEFARARIMSSSIKSSNE